MSRASTRAKVNQIKEAPVIGNASTVRESDIADMRRAGLLKSGNIKDARDANALAAKINASGYNAMVEDFNAGVRHSKDVANSGANQKAMAAAVKPLEAKQKAINQLVKGGLDDNDTATFNATRDRLRQQADLLEARANGTYREPQGMFGMMMAPMNKDQKDKLSKDAADLRALVGKAESKVPNQSDQFFAGRMDMLGNPSVTTDPYAKQDNSLGNMSVMGKRYTQEGDLAKYKELKAKADANPGLQPMLEQYQALTAKVKAAVKPGAGNPVVSAQSPASASGDLASSQVVGNGSPIEKERGLVA